MKNTLIYFHIDKDQSKLFSDETLGFETGIGYNSSVIRVEDLNLIQKCLGVSRETKFGTINAGRGGCRLSFPRGSA